MANIYVHVSKDEKAWLQHMATLYNTSISDLLLTYSIKELEDSYDSIVGELAHKEYINSGKKTVSMTEVIKKFGND
ncbi:type II toxin-antitoxin system RelB family antitoxin [Companilactobacillus mishanensis]|uniref:Antitoxin n=1 Tax=Companilactobacillus mishanensis TaxID=2486008 RepID=A0A5P0ZIR6_9LACO|nr:DUF6290 family protein [Companilactobacillus mishanensis]MQS53006.1 antitoxin [Companilactobacillus mishanensis]